jgi:hypothetical protein
MSARVVGGEPTVSLQDRSELEQRVGSSVGTIEIDQHGHIAVGIERSELLCVQHSGKDIDQLLLVR